MPVHAELDTDDATILVQAEWRYNEAAKNIGFRWRPKQGVWAGNVSWAACNALKGSFGTELIAGPRLKAWLTHEFQTRIKPGSELRYAMDADSPENPDLFPYQKAGVEYLVTMRRAIIADEPGLGKTAQSLRAIRTAYMRGAEVLPLLVVVPSTLKINWAREVAKWWPEMAEKTVVIKGTATQRVKLLNRILDPAKAGLRGKPYEGPRPEIIIINYESLKAHSRLVGFGSLALKRCLECGGMDPKMKTNQCEVHEREINRIKPRSVIVDEAHRAKDMKTATARAIVAAAEDADYRYALTGTPIAKDPSDLWALLHMLDPRQWPRKTMWVERYLKVYINYFGARIIEGVRPERANEFHSTVDPFMRRILKEAALPFLPEKAFEVRTVEMSKKQRDAFNQMREHMIAEIGGGFTTAQSPMIKAMRLLQFASSYAEVLPNTAERIAKMQPPPIRMLEPSNKIDQFIKDIKAGDFGDESVAVSFVNRQFLELLSARMDREGIDHVVISGGVTQDQRTAAVDAFQAKRVKFVLFTAAAGGVGITLTAARYLVRMQRPFSPVDDKQVDDRVHRIGSEHHESIIYIDYVSEDSTEHKVLDILHTKGGYIEDVVQDEDTLLRLLEGKELL